MSLPVLELSSTTKVGVVGLGYVGLPLALTCSKLYSTMGYDLSIERIRSLQKGHDHTGEVDTDELKGCSDLYFTEDVDALRGCDILLITVPTPIDAQNNPDLSLLLQACNSVGKVLTRGSVVILESTVFPGATEELCVPILERNSGLSVNKDFWVGYSPERINPGDKTHRLRDVIKITSGSNAHAAELVDCFYRSFVKAGTHRAPSIRVAEAAKVIENIQRDINIALMNEFSQLFNLMNLDTADILEAACTKWNFLPFKPGLVGGHCIGVDPYYLTYKAREVGFDPEMILAGRKINNSMPRFVANRVCDLLMRSGRDLNKSDVLVLGVTYKENCPDTRNSKSIELVRELRSRYLAVDVCDPVAQGSLSTIPDDIQLNEWPNTRSYDAVILSVAHDEFTADAQEFIARNCKADAIVYDIKHVLPKAQVTERL